MKKVFIKIFIIMMLLFIFDINTNAKTCEISEINRLTNLAKKIEFSKEVGIYNNPSPLCPDCKMAAYDIEALNMNDDLLVRIVDEENPNLYYNQFKKDKNNRYILKGYGSGQVSIYIYAFVENECSGRIIKRTTLKLPYYNPYTGNEECKNYPDFKYCKNEFLDYDLSYESFLKDLKSYQKEEEKANNFKLTSEYGTKGLIIILVIIFIVLGGITFGIIYFTKKKKREEL